MKRGLISLRRLEEKSDGWGSWWRRVIWGAMIADCDIQGWWTVWLEVVAVNMGRRSEGSRGGTVHIGECLVLIMGLGASLCIAVHWYFGHRMDAQNPWLECDPTVLWVGVIMSGVLSSMLTIPAAWALVRLASSGWGILLAGMTGLSGAVAGQRKGS
jgi:hypothetical protein